MHRYFGFAIATLQLFQHPENIKFQFFPLRCPSRNAVSPEIFNEFSKFFLAERRGTWLLCLKIWRAQIFCFFNSNVTTFPTSRKWKNFNFSFYTVPAEMLYPKRILRIFINFFLVKEEEGLYFGGKFQMHRYFPFWNSNVTTFPTCTKCKNFNVSLYTVAAEMLYLQKYITKFQKTVFG